MKDKPNPLAGFSTDDLEDELQRRAEAGEPTRYYKPRPRHYCEGCAFLHHLAMSESEREKDSTFGARCRKGHELVFRLDLDDTDPHSQDWGWHRKDRKKCPSFTEKVAQS